MKKMSQFAVITPTPYLDKLGTRSTYHLALAHIVDKDPEYADFYLERHEAGDYVVMDNGAFELKKPYETDRLIELGNRCGASCLVLPDYPFEPFGKTIQAAEENIDLFLAGGFETMFVPQSVKGDAEGWMQGYRWGSLCRQVDWIGMSILALPNAMPHIHPAYARIVLTQRLLDKGWFSSKKKHHYLGLINASLEIPTLLRMGVLDRCDSSNPVWAAANHRQYDMKSDSYLFPTKSILPEVDFNWQSPPSLEEQFIHCANWNLDCIQSMFENPDQHR